MVNINKTNKECVFSANECIEWVYVIGELRNNKSIKMAWKNNFQWELNRSKARPREIFVQQSILKPYLSIDYAVLFYKM